jgi:hypothetical protein
VRGGLLLSFFLIVATQGRPSAPAEPPTAPAKPLGLLHQQFTQLIGELAGGVVPEAVQKRIVEQPSTFATAPPVVAASSLVLLALLLGSAFLLVAWAWRAWDRAEVGRLFRRKNVKALEPTFAVFLLASLAIFELVLLTAMGWLAELRLAEAGTLRTVGLDVLKLGGLAASPWLVRLAFFYVGEFQFAQTIRRAAAAATVAALAALPVLVWAAITPSRQPSPDAALTLIDRAPWFFLAVPPLILAVALSGVWRYLEPRLTPHVFAGKPRAT